MERLTGRSGFADRNTLKYIVVFLMLLDHAGYAFLPEKSTLYFCFTAVSRVTAPTMCFFLAEGYRHTRDVKRYILRLLVFALISWVPFAHLLTGRWLPMQVLRGHLRTNEVAALYVPPLRRTLVLYPNSVILTLLLGLLTICLWDRGRMHWVWKSLLTLAVLYISLVGDWSYYGVLFCLIFYFLADRPRWKWSAFAAVSLLYIFNLRPSPNIFAPSFLKPEIGLAKNGIFLTVPLLEAVYNGKGGSKAPIHKWFFYIFYPLHLLVIGVIRGIVR